MFNLRTSGVISAAAFLLSLLIGILSHSSMPMLLIRPIIFAIVFFIISALVYLLVSSFLPELLDEGIRDNTPLPGSRVNITEGDTAGFTPGDFPLSPNPSPRGAQADDTEEGLGNISDLVQNRAVSQTSAGESPGGLDQNTQDSYTKSGIAEDFAEPESSSPLGQSPRGADVQAGRISDTVDILPDLDSMAGAFLPASGGGEPDTSEFSISSPSPKPSSGGKTPAWTGDFNAKDMAAGLRTILSKEKEG